MLCSTSHAQSNAQMLATATEVQIIRNGQVHHFPTAIAALKEAQSGDIIELGTGTHQGPLILDKPNLILRGKTNSLPRVNGNDLTWQPNWQRAPEYGPYAWRSPINFEPVTMCIDQRTMIHATESRGGLTVHEGRKRCQEPYSRSLRMVISQNLVRTLCGTCSREVPPDTTTRVV